MTHQIIDAPMALSLFRDAVRAHPLAAWIVSKDEPGFPDRLVARLVTDGPTPYMLVADTLAQLRAQIPPRLARWGPTPADPPGVVEIWYSAGR